MRNYECFEVLQKLERNVKYQNAILEREVQSLDLLKAQGRTQRVDTFGGQANYPHLKEKKVPSLKLSQTQRQPYNFNNHGTSSVERFQSEGYTQLGGYSRASERLRDFEQKSRMLQHERQYIDRQRTDRFREERSERRRQSYQLEFEDYRKIPKESKTKINQVGPMPTKKSARRRQDSSLDEENRMRAKESKTKTNQVAPMPMKSDRKIQDSSSAEDSRIMTKQKKAKINQVAPVPMKSSRKRDESSSEEDFRTPGRQPPSHRSSSRNYTERGGESRRHRTHRSETSEQSQSSLPEEKFNSHRYLQRHIADRYVSDSEQEERSRRKKKRKEEPQPSFVEVAYDKTAEVVGTVKEMLFNGLSKLKQFITTERGKSKTSRSRRRRDDDYDNESLQRYKTPMGRRSSSRIEARRSPSFSSEEPPRPSKRAVSRPVQVSDPEPPQLPPQITRYQTEPQVKIQEVKPEEKKVEVPQPPTIQLQKVETTKKLKSNKMAIHKNYQSSEEKVASRRNNMRMSERQDDQLSQSSRNSSQNRPSPIIVNKKPEQELAKELQKKPPASSPSRGTAQQRKSQVGLTQEQFDQIMMFSEKDETERHRTTRIATQVPNTDLQAPVKITQQPEKKQTTDIQQFLEELADKSEKSSRGDLEEKWPEAAPKKKEDESNLSDLYNRIMSDHQYDFASRKKPEQPLKVVDISLQSEFNPPLAQGEIAGSFLKDQTFQQSSGISELRRVLDNEEGLDNVSECSFQSDYKQQKSNVLDKCRFVQNSIQYSMGNMSQMSGTVKTAKPRPIIANILGNHNNSMHFPKVGLQGTSPYQSEGEDAKLSRKASNTSLLDPLSVPLKKNLNTSSMRQSHSQPPFPFPAPSAFTLQPAPFVKSDNTSSSAAVVMMSESEKQNSGNSVPASQVINLFKEDVEREAAQQRLLQLVNETHVEPVKAGDDVTFKGLTTQQEITADEVVTEEPSEDPSESRQTSQTDNTSVLKKAIMKKLIEIGEEEKVALNDSVEKFIERKRTDAEPQMRSQMSSRKLSARLNTRYGGEAEDSINFELTVDRGDEEPRLKSSRQSIQAVVLPLVTLKPAQLFRHETALTKINPEKGEYQQSNSVPRLLKQEQRLAWQQKNWEMFEKRHRRRSGSGQRLSMQFEETKVELKPLRMRSSSNESWRQQEVTADFWNPTAPSPSSRGKDLPPVARVHSEDESATKPAVTPDMFYQASTKRSSSNTPDLQDVQASPFQAKPFEKHNRTTAHYQTSSDDDGSKQRPQNSRQLMRLVSKGLSSKLPSKPESKPETSQRKAKANISNITDSSERLRENLRAFQNNRLLSKK